MFLVIKEVLFKKFEFFFCVSRILLYSRNDVTKNSLTKDHWKFTSKITVIYLLIKMFINDIYLFISNLNTTVSDRIKKFY